MDTTIRAAQLLGPASSIVLAGINYGSSHLVIPMLYTRSTSVTTPIFLEFYHRGLVTVVPLSIFATTCSGLVAYLHPPQRTLFGLAAGLTICQVPWTQFVMMPTNKRLNAIGASTVEQEKASDQEVVGLLEKWYWMNFVRGSLALAGGLIGVWALIEGQVR